MRQFIKISLLDQKCKCHTPTKLFAIFQKSMEKICMLLVKGTSNANFRVCLQKCVIPAALYRLYRCCTCVQTCQLTILLLTSSSIALTSSAALGVSELEGRTERREEVCRDKESEGGEKRATLKDTEENVELKRDHHSFRHILIGVLHIKICSHSHFDPYCGKSMEANFEENYSFKGLSYWYRGHLTLVSVYYSFS